MTDDSNGENNGMDLLYNEGGYDDFVRFVNDAAKTIKKQGMIPRAYGDCLYYTEADTYEGTAVSIDTDIEVCYWNDGWSWSNWFRRAGAQYLASKGFDMINTNGDYYYILGGQMPTPEKASGFDYTKFHTFDNNTEVIIEDAAGAMFCIWCDDARDEYVGTSAEVIAAAEATIRAFGAALPESKTVSLTDEATNITAEGAGLSSLTIVPLAEKNVPVLQSIEKSVAYSVVATGEYADYYGELGVSIPIPEGWDDTRVHAAVINTKDMAAFALEGESEASDYFVQGEVNDGNYDFSFAYDSSAEPVIVLYESAMPVVPIVMDANEIYELEVEGDLSGTYTTEDTTVATVVANASESITEQQPGEAVTGTVTSGEYYLFDGQGNYLIVDTSANDQGLAKVGKENAVLWNVTVEDDEATLKQGDYYLSTESDSGGGFSIKALATESEYSWNFADDSNELYVTHSNYGDLYLYYNTGGWFGGEASNANAHYVPYTVDTVVTNAKTVLTFYGYKEGTTSVAIGGVTYQITVNPAQAKTEELNLRLGEELVVRQMADLDDQTYTDEKGIVSIDAVHRRQDSYVWNTGVEYGKSYFIMDIENHYLTVENGAFATVLNPTEEHKWLVLQNGDGFSLKYGDYYLVNKNEDGQKIISLSTEEISEYPWYFSNNRGIYCTDRVLSYRLAHNPVTEVWELNSLTTRRLGFPELQINEGVYATEITFTGEEIGETSITIGNVTYHITVDEAQAPEVEDLTIEYWITNNRCADKNSETQETSYTLNYTEAAKNGEEGVFIKDLVAKEAARMSGEELQNEKLVFWKGSINEIGFEQLLNGESKTTTGIFFDRIRFWHGIWSISGDGEAWRTIVSGDQLIAYYIQETEVTTEVTTYAMDWGEENATDSEEGYNCIIGDHDYSYVLLDFAVTYESGTRVPDEFPLTETIAFHCDHDDVEKAKAVHQDADGSWYRELGVIQAENSEDFEVYMITLTPTSDDPDAVLTEVGETPMGIESYSYDGTEKVVWVDDEANLGEFAEGDLKAEGYHEGGTPYVPFIEIYEHQAMLVTYYVRTVSEADKLTVYYYDATGLDAGNTAALERAVEFYNYDIAVNEGVVFDENISLNTDNWKGPLSNGYVTNINGRTESVTSDLTQMSKIAPQYRYGAYTCVEVIRDEDGKTLHLYYSFTDPSYVVDFGLPVRVKLFEEGAATASVITQGTYGTTTIENNYLVYTPTEVIRNIDSVIVNIAETNPEGVRAAATQAYRFYPATTVYYEENFMNTEGSKWTAAGSAKNDSQTATVLGEATTVDYDANYGYDVNYADDGAGCSNGTELTSEETVGYAEFTFVGYGADIYANCTADSGHVNILVRNDEGGLVKMLQVNTMTGAKGSATQGQETDSYSLPIASLMFDTHDTYTVQIRHIKTTALDENGQRVPVYGPVSLDGFRVYNTLADSGVFVADNEAGPNFLEMRNVVLTGLSLGEAVAELGSDYVTASELASVVRKQVVNITENGAGVLNYSDAAQAVVIDNYEGEDMAVTSRDHAYVQDMLENGPKNELYLFEGQSLLFRVNEQLNAQIGLKAVNQNVTYTITGKDGEQTLSSSADMFYKIESGQTIVITNVSGGILSVTDLKWMIPTGDAGGMDPLMELDERDYTEAFEAIGYDREEEVLRVAGANRYVTAYSVADAYKAEKRIEKFNAVIVTTGTNFADALSGSYLASVKKAPILLTNGKADNIAKLHEYIAENVKENGTIYILGGTGAVPEAVETIEGYNVKRLFGADRYETNLAILEEAGMKGSELIVATGKNFADSLSASALKKPVLLVKPNGKMSEGQKALLGKLNGGQIYIIGGTGAVSEAIESTLNAYGNVERIYGTDRYETSAAIARRFFGDVDAVLLASAKDFPDGLFSGPLAAAMNVPLILTAPGKEAAAAAYTAENGIESGIVLGGEGRITDESVMGIFGLGNSAEIVLK